MKISKHILLSHSRTEAENRKILREALMVAKRLIASTYVPLEITTQEIGKNAATTTLPN